MKEQLRAHIDALFASARRSKRILELREEILQNTLDRYDEERAKGKSEQAAFDAAVGAIGDISELIGAHDPRRNGALLAAGIALYLLSLLPPILFAALGKLVALGAGMMLAMDALATVLVLRSGKWGATARGKRRSLAIGLYILSVVPPVALSAFELPRLVFSLVGAGGMLVLLALATLLMILPPRRGEERSGATVAQRIVSEKPLPKSARIAEIVLWSLAGVGAAVLIFCNLWYFAWLPFLAAAILADLLRALMRFVRDRSGAKAIIRALIWAFTLATYLRLSFHTGAWAFTWLVFLIGACLQGVADGIFRIAKGAKKNGEANR